MSNTNVCSAEYKKCERCKQIVTDALDHFSKTGHHSYLKVESHAPAETDFAEELRNHSIVPENVPDSRRDSIPKQPSEEADTDIGHTTEELGKLGQHLRRVIERASPKQPASARELFKVWIAKNGHNPNDRANVRWKDIAGWCEYFIKEVWEPHVTASLRAKLEEARQYIHSIECNDRRCIAICTDLAALQPQVELPAKGEKNG